jgi:hypothetical protein
MGGLPQLTGPLGRPNAPTAVLSGRPTDEAQRAIEESRMAGRSSGTSRPYPGPFRFAQYSAPTTARATQAFEEARLRLEAMLSGKEPLELNKAVEVMERPLLDSTVQIGSTTAMVDRLAAMVRARLVEQGLDPHDPEAVHLGIQQLYRDTFLDPLSGKEWRPLRYDFEDPNGENELAQVTVAKLLWSGEGQCRSMPLLYLMVAERMQVEAYLAFAPNHSYVKFRDRSGTYLNFETTNGRLASDAWIAGSGYVKTEGIKSRAYLDTVGTRRMVAHLLVDLATYYEQRFGYNAPFMERCLERALQEYPQDIHGWLELSNLRTATFDRAAWAEGYPQLASLPTTHPDLAQRYAALKALYGKVDRMGYAPMPPEAYARWRSSVDIEREARARKELAQPLQQPALSK